jgi:hypothetical protein
MVVKKNEEKEENAKRAFAHTKNEGERQTRFIYSSNQPPGNTHIDV